MEILLSLILAMGAEASSLSSSYSHNCAVKNGAALCWGLNGSGQLGNGSKQNAGSAKVVPGLESGVTAVTAGQSHSCALKDGEVWCWGQGTFGRLGDGGTSPSLLPVKVEGIEGATDIEAGDATTCAIVAGGLQCWGWNFSCQLGRKPCAGGQGSTGDFSSVPVWVTGLGPGSGVTGVSVGQAHTCALVRGGLQCWGATFHGRLGVGESNTDYIPEPGWVSGIGEGAGVTGVEAGNYNTCALVRGEMRCWGWGMLLGAGRAPDARVPQRVSGLPGNLVELNLYRYTVCAHNRKEFYCWGSNVNGQFGNGSQNERAVLTPMKLPLKAEKMGRIQSGMGHTCLEDGETVKCMGWNAFCQIGMGDCEKDNQAQDMPFPRKVTGL